MTATTFPTKAASTTRSIPAWALPAFVGAVVFVVGALIVDGLPVGVTHDDSMYVVLAKSLATGHGYRWLNLPGAPPATHYPPGYPAVLALLWLMFPAFPASVVAFKLANAAFMGLAAVGVFAYARARFGMNERGAAILALLLTLGIPTLTLGALVMSEPLFLALLIPTLIGAERVIDGEPGRWRELLLLGVIAGALTLIRTQGIALIGATAVVLCTRRRLRDAAVFAAATLAMVMPWQIWVSTHAGVVPAAMSGNYESYGAWLRAGLHDAGPALFVRTALRTTREIAQNLEVLFAVVLPPAVRVAALLPLGILAVIGARPLWRRSPVAALFLGLYFAMVIFWPFPPSRFVWAVWPFVALVPLLGQRELLAWHPSLKSWRAARATMLIAGVLLAVGYSVYNVRGYRRQWWASIPVAMSRNIDPL
ncbi:MAG TPA: glycosyltransferase family 39 protein, partial [Gemmatimonadaceae bacterium]